MNCNIFLIVTKFVASNANILWAHHHRFWGGHCVTSPKNVMVKATFSALDFHWDCMSQVHYIYKWVLHVYILVLHSIQFAPSEKELWVKRPLIENFKLSSQKAVRFTDKRWSPTRSVNYIDLTKKIFWYFGEVVTWRGGRSERFIPFNCP